MTVKELIEKLNEIDDKEQLVLCFAMDIYGEFAGVEGANVDIYQYEEGVVISVH